MKNTLDYPASKSYYKSFLENCFIPTQKKQSTSVSYLPGIGRNSFIKYLMDRKDKIKADYEIDFSKTAILICDDVNNETDAFPLWVRNLEKQGIRDPLLKDVSNGYEMIDVLTNKLDINVVFSLTIINSENNDYRWLEHMRNENSLKINFQIGFYFECEPHETANYLGGLTKFILQNHWYMPLYDSDSVLSIINTQIKGGYVNTTDAQNKKIIELSGGHPLLVRYFLRNLDKLGNPVLDNELLIIFNQLWDNLSESSKTLMFELINSGKISSTQSNYLTKTHLLKETNGVYSFFSPIFTDYVKSLDNRPASNITTSKGVIEIGGIDIRTLLSKQEYAGFSLLYRNKGKIVDRDALAEALWGDGWEDNYSDWAIGQVIRRIRTKLGDRSNLPLIKTLRGQGFLVE